MNRTYVPYDERAEHVHFKGDWASGTTYNYGDEVANDGAEFVCILAHVATAGLEPIPEADESIAGPKGDDGAIGPTGLQGPIGPPGGEVNHWALFEVPAGDKDGSNQSFTLAHTPTGQVSCIYNGREMQDTVDSSSSGTTLTLLTFAPDAAKDDRFWVRYPYA